MARRLTLGLGVLACHTIALLVALGPRPRPMWDDAHFLWSGARFFDLVREAGAWRALTTYQSVKPWLLELVYFPLYAGGVHDVRAFLSISVLAYGSIFVVIFLAGRRSAAPGLALACALGATSAFRVSTFALTTQTEIFMCLGMALGVLAMTGRDRRWLVAGTLGAADVLLMAGKQSSVVYVAGLAALFLVCSRVVSRRARVQVLLVATLLSAVYLVPTYWLNLTPMLDYARDVAGLPGQSFPAFVRELVRDSVGYPACAAMVLTVVAARYLDPRGFGSRAAVVSGVLAAWIVVFGAVLSHNVFRYILPAIPLFAAAPFLSVDAPGDAAARVPKWCARMAVVLGVVSLSLAQASAHHVRLPPGLSGGAPGYGRGDFCNEPVSEWLAARRPDVSSERDFVVWVAGDHAFLNYEVLSWQLELLGYRRYRVSLLANPLPDLLRRSAGERADLLLVVDLRDGHNLTPAEAMRALVDHLDATREWSPLASCAAPAGGVRAYVPVRAP